MTISVLVVSSSSKWRRQRLLQQRNGA